MLWFQDEGKKAERLKKWNVEQHMKERKETQKKSKTKEKSAERKYE